MMGSIRTSTAMKLCFSMAIASVTWLYSAADAQANEMFTTSQCEISAEAPAQIECSYVVDQDAPRIFKDAQIDLKFERLVQEWRTERGASSSLNKAITSPAYCNIIGMGEPAVPLIMQKMRSEGDDPDFWFWALESITEANPTTQEDQGDSIRMAAKWLAWYDENYSG